MTQDKHIIKRQVIEVQIASQLDNIEVQERVAKIYNQKVISLLDNFLTERSLQGYNGKIDHLELDLGLINIENLESSFVDKVESELKNKLSKLRSVIDIVDVKEENSTTKNTDLDLVVYYLRTGSFPWWAQEASYTILDKAFDNVLEKNASATVNLILTLCKDKSILRRLVYTFNDQILEKFLDIILPSKSESSRNLHSALESRADRNFSASKCRENSWCALIQLCLSADASGRNSSKKVVEILSRFLDDNKISAARSKLLSDNPEIIRTLNQVYDLNLEAFPAKEFEKAYERFGQIQKSAESIFNLSHPLNLKKYLDEVSNYFLFLKKGGWIGERLLKEDLSQLNIYLLKVQSSLSGLPNIELSMEQDKQAVGEILKDIDKHLGQIKSVLKTIHNDNLLTTPPLKEDIHWNEAIFRDLDRKPFDDFSTSDKIYIQNAGLVLLWPFLSRFFENLELLNDKAFVDERAAEKACLMLQYLPEGQAENIFEAHLPLNKVLCGIELEQPVNTQVSIDAEEAEACDDFLKAVIGNVPLWKNVSLTGFRQAYLKREGALGTRDGNWLLQVKREAYDVMVDKLPWPVQVVRLPWMEHVIFVEWQKG